MTAVITPGDNKAAFLESRYIGLILGGAGITVYPELTDNFGAIIAKNTGPYIVTAARSRSVIMTTAVAIPPGHNKITIRK